MINENYISFEVAKLLKEKGFDEPCLNRYCTDGRFSTSILHYKNSEINKDSYNAPTHQMAMKWLREVHNKHAQIEYNLHLSWYYDIIDLKETDFHDYDDTKHWHYKCDFKSYEEAVEAALKYCLENLI